MLQSVLGRLGYVPRSALNARQMYLRDFKAGKSSRLYASWYGGDHHINTQIYNGLRVMRMRSRDLFANNEYAKRFATLLRTQVIGSRAMTFRNRSRRTDNNQIDRLDNRIVEERYADFSKRRNYTVTGTLSRTEVEQLCVETQARDGEYLVRKIYDASLPHGMALQLIDIDRLDIEANERNRDTGNQIIMGVEVTPQFRPVAYHILNQHPRSDRYTQGIDRKHTRVLADEIIHGFMPMRAEQVRGVPWLHAAMIALWDIGEWRDAAIINAKVGAQTLGFLRGPTRGGADAGESFTTDINDVGERLNASEAGIWNVLQEDVEVETFNAPYPHAMHAAFEKAMLRGVAAGMGVAYFNLANDAEAVNYSSAKIGQAPERELYMWIQEDLAETLHEGYHADWFERQLFNGQFGPMPVTNESLTRNNRPTWKGKRWLSTEPLRETQSDSMRIGMRLTSTRRVMEQAGIDADEEWLIEAEDQQTLASLGISQNLPTTVMNIEPEDEQDQASQEAQA